MLTLKICGTVKEAETDIGLSGLLVKIYDKNLHFDHLFGQIYTGEAGHFEFVSESEDLCKFLDAKPDLYLKIFAPGIEEPLYTTEKPLQWSTCGLEDIDISIPHDCLGDMAPERGIRFLADDNSIRETYDVGESLIVQINGVRPATVHYVVLSEDNGSELFTSHLLSNRYGVIEAMTIWPQIGLDDPHSDKLLSLKQAQAHWQGHKLVLEVREGEKILMKSAIKVADKFERPILFSTDSNGMVLNGFEAGDHDAIVSGYNLPFHGRARVYMVPRQQGWWPGDRFTPVKLASDRPAFVDVDIKKDEGNFNARIARASELEPGAYDFIVRFLRYGYEDDEDFVLRNADIVAYRNIPGLTVRGYLRESNVILEAIRVLPISGRSINGPPYFQYADTFQLGEDIYAALDPASIDPNKMGKMVALYVIPHPSPKTSWNRQLNHLQILGGNAAVQRLKTQVGSINLNKLLIWPNARIPGDYDIVADFGNNSSDASKFIPNDRFDPNLDIIDGYFVAGFRIVPDPTTMTTFPYAGYHEYNLKGGGFTGTYTTGDVDEGGNHTVVPLEGIVYFPVDVLRPGASTPVQISSARPNYPIIIIVHGQGHSYNGYNYLLEHFAKNGFIAAGIHLESGMKGTGRAELVFQHLAILKTKFGTRLSNNIGLMGHSRGGEAVVIAAWLNNLQNRGYNIHAIISLAPTSQYFFTLPPHPPRPVEEPVSLRRPWAAPYLVIYGAMDGDTQEIGNNGFRLYDRANGMEKCMIFIYGASHNRFSNTLPDSDLEKKDDNKIPYFTNNEKNNVLSNNAHEAIAKSYMTAFFRKHFYGEDLWDGMFRGEWIPAAVRQADQGKVKLYVQYACVPENVKIIDNFRGPQQGNWRVSSCGGSVEDDNTLAVYPENPREDKLSTMDRHSPHDARGCLVRWYGLNSRLRFNLPSPLRDISIYNSVSFRVTQKVGSTMNPPDQSQDFYLKLSDAYGKSRSIKVSMFGEIPPPKVREYNQGALTKSAMCTILIPLHAFTIEDGTERINLQNVTSLTFEFKAIPTGEIEITDIEFML